MRRSKILIFTLILTLFAFVGFSVKTNAATATSDLIKVEGAQVRTEGTVGIRFVGKIESSYTNAVTSYGIAVAFGDVEASQITIGGTVNGMAILNAECDELDEDRNFFISLLGMPDNMYGQKVTTRAYVKNGSNVTYATTATVRSLAEVTIEAKKNNETGTNINNVVSKLSSSYKKAYLNEDKKFVIESTMEGNYSSLALEFISDWNEKFSTSLTSASFTGGTSSAWYKSAKTTVQTDWTSSKLKEFFQDANYKAKWSWLFTYIKEELSSGTGFSFASKQIDAIVNNIEDTENWYYSGHLCSMIMSIMTGSKQSSGWGNFDFGANPNKLLLLIKYNNSIFSNLSNCSLYKIGETIKLPNAVSGTAGTEFDGWYLNSTKYLANGNYLVSTDDVIFEPRYSTNGLASVQATLNPNGGMFDTETLLNDMTPAQTVKITNYLTYDATYGYTASLNNKVPAKFWYYLALTKTSITNVYKIEQIVYQSANVTADYDYVVMWFKDMTDTTSKKALDAMYDNESSYIGSYVVLDNVPSSGTSSANITMKVFSEESTKSSFTKTFLTEEALPTPIRVGYNFTGWLCSLDNKLYTTYPTYSVNPGNITYTAQWEAGSLEYASSVAYDTTSYVKVGEKIKLNVYEYGTKVAYSGLTWSSVDSSIATVDQNGYVTGVKNGFVKIRAGVSATNYVEFGVTVIDNNLTGLLKLIVDSHQSNVFTKYNLGIGAGTPVYYYDVIGSVNNILFNESLVIDTTYANTEITNGTGDYRSSNSVEFITVHYTGNMSKGADAEANAKYFVGDNSTSIHYTTGNDGVFQALPHKYGAWHAGNTSTLTYSKTKVPVKNTDPKYPEFGINSSSNFTINGIDTGIKVPNETTKGYGYVTASKWLNDMGLAYYRGTDGYYYIGSSYWCYSQVAEGRICSDGGNNNSIGIESCVDKGSDLWYTWHKTAQLCAKLLKEYNFGMEKLVGHHFFTAKDCPQPMLENDSEIWKIFRDMVESELILLQQYSNYTVKMEVVEGNSALAKTGRITQLENSKVVTYKVTITNKTSGISESIILSSVIEGTNSK